MAPKTENGCHGRHAYRARTSAQARVKLALSRWPASLGRTGWVPQMVENRCAHGHGLDLKLKFGSFLEYVQAVGLDVWMA